MGDEGGKDTPNIAEELEQFGERRALIKKGALRHRVEPARLLLITNDRTDGVTRTYLKRVVPNNSLEASSSYHLYPDGWTTGRS